MNRKEASSYISAMMKYFDDLDDQQLECAKIALTVVQSRRHKRPVVIVGTKETVSNE